MQALRNSSGFEPLCFSTANQGERNGSPLMVSVIRSVATLSVATNPSSVVNWSIVTLQIEMDIESDRKPDRNAVLPSPSARPHDPRSLQFPSRRSRLTVETDPAIALEDLNHRHRMNLPQSRAGLLHLFRMIGIEHQPSANTNGVTFTDEREDRGGRPTRMMNADPRRRLDHDGPRFAVL